MQTDETERESRPSLPMCCLAAAAVGGPCPVCAPVVARVACEACATLAAELGRDVGCLRHPRETATPDEGRTQSVVDVGEGEGSEGR